MPLAEQDLKLGYVALRRDLINFPELKACLEISLKTEGSINLGQILVREGYLSRPDFNYLQMILARTDEDASDYPLLAGTKKLTLQAIYEEYLSNFTLRKGAMFGKFRILDIIGKGGMGVVLLAEESGEEGPIALKILSGGPKANVRAIELFKKEATIMAQLRHRNIVEIYEVGREKGLDYITMEYIDGESLKELVQAEEFLPAKASLKLIRGIAEALTFIHRRGIYHRDLKPDNIMLKHSGRPVLMDFGLAAFEKIEIKGLKGSVGTPLYQPPEQAEVGGRFGPIGPPSDVYGLGATLYFMITGQPPFTARDRKTLKKKVLFAQPDPPSEVNPEVPPEIEDIVLRCLEKKQEDRYAGPEELIKAIDRYSRFKSNRSSGSHRTRSGKKKRWRLFGG